MTKWLYLRDHCDLQDRYHSLDGLRRVEVEGWTLQREPTRRYGLIAGNVSMLSMLQSSIVCDVILNDSRIASASIARKSLMSGTPSVRLSYGPRWRWCLILEKGSYRSWFTGIISDILDNDGVFDSVSQD